MIEYRVELIAAFDKPDTPVPANIPFLRPDGPVMLGHIAKINQELLNSLGENNWVLKGVAPTNNLVYGFFQKTT